VLSALLSQTGRQPTSSSTTKSVGAQHRFNKTSKLLPLAAAAAEVEKTNLEAQKKRRVAAFEDHLRKEDQQREKSMARPDLVTALPHSLIV
jgi:hypothetical protein